MTYFQPPGYVHVMNHATWADVTVQATQSAGPAALPFAAQLAAAGGKTLVLRVVNAAAGAQPVSVALAAGAAAGPSYTLWTLGGAAYATTDDNSPGRPTFIAPVQAQPAIAPGATTIAFTLEPHTYAIAVVTLQ